MIQENHLERSDGQTLGRCNSSRNNPSRKGRTATLPHRCRPPGKMVSAARAGGAAPFPKPPFHSPNRETEHDDETKPGRASKLLHHKLLIKIFRNNEAHLITLPLTKNIVINIWVRAKRCVVHKCYFKYCLFYL